MARNSIFFPMLLFFTISCLFEVTSSFWVRQRQRNDYVFNPYTPGFNNSIVFSILPNNFFLRQGNRFGRAIAVCNNIALISATNLLLVNSENTVIADSAVFVFQRSQDGSWSEYRDMLLSGAELLSDGFGESLAVTDQIAVVGAWKDNSRGTFSGRAYVFFTNDTRSTVQYADRQAIYASDSSPGDFFGYSVAVCTGFKYYDDGVVLVGAYGYDIDNRNINTGAVYIYARTDGIWTQVSVLQPSLPCAYCSFGWALDAQGGIFVVGSPTYSDTSAGNGAAYVYRLSSESSVVSCTEQKCMHQTTSGAVNGHTFRVSTVWTAKELAVLSGSEPGQLQDLFGGDVALSVDPSDSADGGSEVVTVAVSAFQDSQYASNSGKVYLFQTTLATVTTSGTSSSSSSSTSSTSGSGVWMLVQKIVGEAGARLGSCLSLWEGRLLVGADYAGKAPGSAYVYTADESMSRPVWFRLAALPRPGLSGDYFGASCAQGDVFAVVGAFQMAGAGSGGRQYSASGTGLAVAFSSEAGTFLRTNGSPSPYSLEDLYTIVASIAFVSVLFAVVIALFVFRSLYLKFFIIGPSESGPDRWMGSGFNLMRPEEPTLGPLDVSTRSTDALFVNSADHIGLPAPAPHYSAPSDGAHNQKTGSKTRTEERLRTSEALCGPASRVSGPSSFGTDTMDESNGSREKDDFEGRKSGRAGRSKVAQLLQMRPASSFAGPSGTQPEADFHSTASGRDREKGPEAPPLPVYASFRPENEYSSSGLMKQTKTRQRPSQTGSEVYSQTFSQSWVPTPVDANPLLRSGANSKQPSPQTYETTSGAFVGPTSNERKVRSLRESARYGSASASSTPYNTSAGGYGVNFGANIESEPGPTNRTTSGVSGPTSGPVGSGSASARDLYMMASYEASSGSTTQMGLGNKRSP